MWLAYFIKWYQFDFLKNLNYKIYSYFTSMQNQVVCHALSLWVTICQLDASNYFNCSLRQCNSCLLLDHCASNTLTALCYTIVFWLRDFSFILIFCYNCLPCGKWIATYSTCFHKRQPFLQNVISWYFLSEIASPPQPYCHFHYTYYSRKLSVQCQVYI